MFFVDVAPDAWPECGELAVSAVCVKLMGGFAALSGVASAPLMRCLLLGVDVSIVRFTVAGAGVIAMLTTGNEK